MSLRKDLTFGFGGHQIRIVKIKRTGVVAPARPTERTDQGSLADHVNERSKRDTVHIKHFRELRKRAIWSLVWSQVVAALRVCIRQRS